MKNSDLHGHHGLDQSEPESWLAWFPVAFFPVVMGLSGLALAWQKAAVVLSLPVIIGNGLALIAAFVMLLISSCYLIKCFKFGKQVADEFAHPVKLSFFPAWSIGLLLLAGCLMPFSKELATALWVVGSLAHLILSITVINRWIYHPQFNLQHITPAWFIPVVGNALVPIAGVALGFEEISWMFFSVGMIFWLVLKVLVFNRLIFHEPLPDQLLPTLFILIAPPAAGFVAWMALSHGQLNGIGRALFSLALFLALLLLSQYRRFSRIRFFMSWWAYSFPLAALSVACQIYFEQVGGRPLQALAWGSLLLVSFVVPVLTLRTIQAILSGGLFKPGH
ncbi:SLAC1 anion channel family protein [Pelagibaculum spongiae]|uniref:C4-dicarboxylate ABC transporter n=1 Tax=Pelagibaculum spongiae TaxID=2080658 RepID=A0A2V1GZS5_9GAMM|nr:SLAC1 anion channel family protein [Pelagibaculum spongiae]PVZ68831.1 C4-dicarboxylate ABC transporter [Pelagibaculum spongiae]